jgi:glycosyltransferase involved in cell wall biosynthesis
VLKQAVSIVTAEVAGEERVEFDRRIAPFFVEGDVYGMKGRLRAPSFTNALVSALASRDSPAIIHQHGVWLRSSHQTTRFAVKNQIPLVLAPRGMLEPWALNHSKWKKKLAWLAFQQRDLRAVTAFHATAQSEAESIRRLGFKQPIAVIPNGIALPNLAGSGEQGARSGEQGARSGEQGARSGEQGARGGEQGARSGDQEKRTALFLSRINPKKGLPMLLDAWKRVAPVGWRLVIAGNDDSHHLPVVEREIRELGLGNQVTIAGPLFGDAKEAAYRNADLFVLPSYSENFGIVVAEALSYGLPVLTTTGCPWQALETHYCGWWVEPTPVGIESALNKALSTTNEELAAMGASGRALVKEKYQWPGIAERMLEFYEWILNGGTQPDFVV